MRDDYLQAALKIVGDPNILVNMVSARVKQLKRGNRALIESLEKLLPEDVALREIAEGRITYELATAEEIAAERRRNAQTYGVSNIRSASRQQAAGKAAVLQLQG